MIISIEICLHQLKKTHKYLKVLVSGEKQLTVDAWKTETLLGEVYLCLFLWDHSTIPGYEMVESCSIYWTESEHSLKLEEWKCRVEILQRREPQKKWVSKSI